jgi:hypothetical protein
MRKVIAAKFLPNAHGREEGKPRMDDKGEEFLTANEREFTRIVLGG